MRSNSVVVLFSALAAYADAHAVILGAQGEAGTPESVGFRVVPELARNCTNISPCQQDATLIRDEEIAQNIVNTCGRTELSGNIDVGEETENAIAANKVTGVKAGTEIGITIHQVNADGAGPFFCDLDSTSNGGTFQNLSVTNNVPGSNGLSQAKAQQFQIKVKMPADLNCAGASTGDICTVRCRNAALAGPFGGCFAVKQIGKQGKKNVPSDAKVVKDLKTVTSQVAQNKKDFAVANKAIQQAGTPEAVAAEKELNKALNIEPPKVKEFPVENPDVTLGAPASANPAAGGNGKGTNNNGAKKSNNNRGKNNAAGKQNGQNKA